MPDSYNRFSQETLWQDEIYKPSKSRPHKQGVQESKGPLPFPPCTNLQNIFYLNF